MYRLTFTVLRHRAVAGQFAHFHTRDIADGDDHAIDRLNANMAQVVERGDAAIDAHHPGFLAFVDAPGAVVAGVGFQRRAQLVQGHPART